MKTWKYTPYFEFVDDPDNRTAAIVLFNGTTINHEGVETLIQEQVTIETDTTGIPFQVVYENLMDTFSSWKTTKLGDA
tara:strand:+ start:3789 stop:4022 length:234 start_codon:yes stop_codon:yes gene_type:complete